MIEHHLKTWPDFFQPIIDGQKTFEVRVNDRDFHPGDLLILEEYDPTRKIYTGRVTYRRVGFMLLGGQFGLPANTVIMSLLPMKS